MKRLNRYPRSMAAVFGLLGTLMVGVLPVAAQAEGPAMTGTAPDVPGAVPAPAAPSTPAACASVQEFYSTDCPLTWRGITVYGTYDVGVGWVSHGLPENGHN